MHTVVDKCAYIRANCQDEEAGIFSYLQLYYCKLPHLKPVAFFILVLWLGLLFSTIGIAASDFFCINLSTIANTLGMSESLAGVTFLAFGNGSPDVFSTFAAMSTNSGSLAVGELIGAAGFITAVVAGSMALVRPFHVARKSFVRDVGFFIVAASFSMVFLSDGYLHLWECAVMVTFYAFYVFTVVIWHWYLRKKSRRKEREALARSHFNASGNESNEMEGDIDELDDSVGRSRRSRGYLDEDFSALERARSPSIVTINEEADAETRDRYMAEISSNMRVSRLPRGERRNTTTPIRPSLVGALEFRAVLSSLRRSRNIQTIPIGLRRYSDDPTYTLAQQLENTLTMPIAETEQSHSGVADLSQQNRSKSYVDQIPRLGRVRAVSANDATGLQLDERALQSSIAPRTNMTGPTSFDISRPPGNQSPIIPGANSDRNALVEPVSPRVLISPPPGENLARGNDNPYIVQGMYSDHLAPPRDETNFSRDGAIASRGLLHPDSHFTVGKASPNWSTDARGSSSASPFPAYHDDPDFCSTSPRSPSLTLPSQSAGADPMLHQPKAIDASQRLVRWWPYRLLPPPMVLVSTLFPTLYSWRDKNVWEKLLGVVAAPSIFMLAITLPVVEMEIEEQFTSIVVHGSPQTTNNNHHHSHPGPGTVL